MCGPLLVALALSAVPPPFDPVAPDVPGWLRPVDGAVVRPFEEPGAGVRPRTPGSTWRPCRVHRSAGPRATGAVSFAGQVGGTLHVTISHAGNLRTSYSFLSSVAVRVGQSVARGDVVGATGGSGPDHDGHVLHFGLRVGDRYVDPMALFSPTDLTALVHLVKAGAPDETAVVAGERSGALAGHHWRCRRPVATSGPAV